MNKYYSLIVGFAIVATAFSNTEKNETVRESMDLLHNSETARYRLFNIPNYLSNLNPPKKNKHFLGEIFNGGIVFKLSKTKNGVEHGLVVSLTESIPLTWQSTIALVNANAKDSGEANTGLMTNSPAAIFVSTLGKGWYLPSSGELSILYENRYYVQKSLEKGKHTMVSLVRYWSSTEHDATFAYYLDFADGSSSNYHKSGLYPVRGIKSF
jgi:hypothetical protein